MAARKNAAHARKPRAEKKAFRLRGMNPREKKTFYALAVVVALTVVLLTLWGLDAFPHGDGSMRVRGGRVHAEEGALVVNRGDRKNPRYFQIARVKGVVDGFSQTDFSTHVTDENITDYWYEPDEPGEVFNYYLCGIAQRAEDAFYSSAEIRGLVKENENGEGTYVENEVRGAFSDGRPYVGYAISMKDADVYGGAWHRYLYAYFDAAEDSSVLIAVSDKQALKKNLSDEQTLIGFLEKAYACVEVEK